ncbi:hypothetical protein TNCV_2377181 [Trichonephila clavipes]|nr:hypothetical protein TNCV_2377181 [Trichonephila clavipes]
MYLRNLTYKKKYLEHLLQPCGCSYLLKESERRPGDIEIKVAEREVDIHLFNRSPMGAAKQIPASIFKVGMPALRVFYYTINPWCKGGWVFKKFGLAIHQNDHQARRRFVEWAQNEMAVIPDFHKRILFSDAAHFWLNGYVNKQNCRIWSEANPQVYVETPLHPEKLTVWCALWAGGIIGPYFFKNDEGHNVSQW